ncbi:MAG: hypothetical protein GKR98_00405 [Boseongicola sp.]|nr:MAG: hypothetical protein GKR98_00405 [Boseongicola sp.]
MSDTANDDRAKFGLAGFLLGAVAVLVILIQLSAFFAPKEEKSTGQVIGEIAADIRQSAQRALSGEPAPPPPPPQQDYSQIITIGALCLAGLAIALGGIGLFKHEPRPLSFMAVGFGASAFVMHYVFWLAILICGIALLISIINNLDGILGG